MEEKKTPDKGKLLLKSYAMSLLSLMLCVTMLVGTTYAWFTSDVTTGSNEIQVGTLKVDMVKKNADNTVEPIGGKTNLFGSGTAKWEPGATWFETIQVKNYGDLAFDYTLRFNTVGQEIANIDTVGKYIDVYVTTNGADCKNTEDILTKWVRVGTLADVVRHNMLLTSGSWVPNPEKENVCIVDTVSIALHMPTSFTGFDGKTDLMGKTLSGFGLRMTATQKIHETDGFGDDGYYDQGASTKLLAGTPAELAAAFQDGMDVKLTNNISLDADTTLTVKKGAKMVLDLNGFGISATSNTIGANRELFLVMGNLTVTDTAPATATVATAGAEPAIARGITYQHTGANMKWDKMSTIFDVTDGGVLTLNNVKCENLGGTDMNFVAHLNNWGEASLYANNAYLKAPYCVIRAFNSGYDMNNVVVRNSTLKADNMAFWVHNYHGDLDSSLHSAEAIDARLNINILNGTNTIQGKIRYGFGTAEVPYIAKTVSTADELEAALTTNAKEIDITLANSIDYDLGTGKTLGGSATETITIKGLGQDVTTLNLTSTYRNYFNSNAALKLQDLTLTHAQTGSHFYDYTMHFNCDLVAENVRFGKPILINSGVKAQMSNIAMDLDKNITYYAMFIMAGADVTIDKANIGAQRGLKIADEDVTDPQITNLFVKNAVFNTTKKAAILVTSTAGANVTLENVDISNVAADATHAVWVDEARAAYFDAVTVTGGAKAQE